MIRSLAAVGRPAQLDAGWRAQRSRVRLPRRPCPPSTCTRGHACAATPAHTVYSHQGWRRGAARAAPGVPARWCARKPPQVQVQQRLADQPERAIANRNALPVGGHGRAGNEPHLARPAAGLAPPAGRPMAANNPHARPPLVLQGGGGVGGAGSRALAGGGGAPAVAPAPPQAPDDNDFLDL